MKVLESKAFGQDISQLVLRSNMKCFDKPKLDFLLNEITINLNVLCSLVIDRIYSNMDSSLAITKQKSNLWMRNSKIFK